MTVLLPLLITLGLMLGAVLWMAFGLPELLSFTYHVLELCQNIFARCAAYYDLSKLVFLWLGVSVAAAGFLYGIVKGTASLLRTGRAVKKLPLSRRCGSVVLIRDNVSMAAFTFGLLRPVIYVSTGLLASLDRDEIKAVLLHELHHKRRLDPLRFFILTLLKDIFFYIPLIKYLVGYIRFKKERDADDAARAYADGPLSLAGALLKVAAFQKDIVMMQASITGGIEGGAVAARVRRLVEGRDAGFRLPALRTVTVSLFMVFFLALSLALPLNAAYPGAKECSKKQCAMHSKKAVGSQCAMHSKRAAESHCETAHRP